MHKTTYISRAKIARYQFHRLECPNESKCRCWQRCQSPDAKRPPRWATIVDDEAITIICLDFAECANAKKTADQDQAQEASTHHPE